MTKFKLIRQHDAMECGVASLAMICAYYGKNIPLYELSKICLPTQEGVSLKGLKDTSERIGLNSVVGFLKIDDIRRINKPLILHWQHNHFVVLYKVSNDGKYFFVADPARGKCRYNINHFKKNWISNLSEDSNKGIAMYLFPSQSFSNADGENVNLNSFRFLFSYITRYKYVFSLVFAGLLIGSVLQLSLPFLTQWIVDLGIRHEDLGFIWLVLCGELMIVIGRTSTDFIRRWILLHVSMRINISLISDFFIKLLQLPMFFFDTKMMGDLLQRINDHSRVESFLTNQTLGLMFSILNFIVFGIVLLHYNLLVFSIFLIGSLVYGIWIASFLNKRRNIDYEIFEQKSINQNRTYQFITSMQEIKLQGCERRRRWEWEDTQADLFAVQMRSLKLQQTQEAGSIFINEVKNMLITVFAATAVINGRITLGAMLAIQYIVGQLNSPVEQLMQFIYSLQDVRISLERINEIHVGKDEEPEGNRATDFPSGKSISISRVDFKYDRHALKDTLTDISFEIPEGKVTAIVGASGSGKTTLIKLMLGYYPVLSGSISIAGRDINEYNLRWWRSHCGVVMQDGVIFSESIERNIAVDDGQVDPERLERAARIANIHDYVMGLPLKYNTIIGRDGVGLSQGQKQRILIARAVYKDPDFIFLDEATNALDAKNERAIVENLDGFYRGRTVVVVAHRLSTVKNADRIVVLDGGKVVEVGDHASLIGKRGTYYNLVKNQLELGN